MLNFVRKLKIFGSFRNRFKRLFIRILRVGFRCFGFTNWTNSYFELFGFGLN